MWESLWNGGEGWEDVVVWVEVFILYFASISRRVHGSHQACGLSLTGCYRIFAEPQRVVSLCFIERDKSVDIGRTGIFELEF